METAGAKARRLLNLNFAQFYLDMNRMEKLQSLHFMSIPVYLRYSVMIKIEDGDNGNNDDHRKLQSVFCSLIHTWTLQVNNGK